MAHVVTCMCVCGGGGGREGCVRGGGGLRLAEVGFVSMGRSELMKLHSQLRL